MPRPWRAAATYTVYSATPAYQGRWEKGASADHAATAPSSATAHHTGARSPRPASQARRSEAGCGPVANVAKPLAAASS